MIYNLSYTDLFMNLLPSYIREWDFEYEDGDFKVDNINEQDIEIMLFLKKGQVYYEPTIGVYMQRYRNANINKAEMRKLIRENLEELGFKNIDIIIANYNDLLSAGVTDSDILSIAKENRYIMNMDYERD